MLVPGVDWETRRDVRNDTSVADADVLCAQRVARDARVPSVGTARPLRGAVGCARHGGGHLADVLVPQRTRAVAAVAASGRPVARRPPNSNDANTYTGRTSHAVTHETRRALQSPASSGPATERFVHQPHIRRATHASPPMDSPPFAFFSDASSLRKAADSAALFIFLSSLL